MQNSIESVQQFKKALGQLRVMVVGDIMMDAYTWGRVERISPEAPVPVVNVLHREERPGGAANVAINLNALGVRTFLCGLAGNDANGKQLTSLIKKQKINTQGILLVDKYVTTVKTRIIGNNHQLLRVDDERYTELTKPQADKFIAAIIATAQRNNVDAIIFEDYDKGTLNKTVIEAVVEFALAHNIFTAVDPKKKNFFNYKNVTLFKPNLHELENGLQQAQISTNEIAALANSFARKQRIQSMLVTLSEKGIYYGDAKTSGIIAAHIRNIADVSGAGDTVISVATCCLALQMPLSQIAAIANIAGGLVCEKAGVVPILLTELLQEIKQHSILA